MSRLLDSIYYKLAMDGDDGEVTPPDGPDAPLKPRHVGRAPGQPLPPDVLANAHAGDPEGMIAVPEAGGITAEQVGEAVEQSAEQAVEAALNILEQNELAKDAAEEYEALIDEIAYTEDEKVAEHYGPYIEMGHEFALGLLGGQAKAAMQMKMAETGVDPQVAEAVEAVGESIAEKMCEVVPPEVLADPEAQEAIAEAATEAATAQVAGEIAEAKEAMLEYEGAQGKQAASIHSRAVRALNLDDQDRLVKDMNMEDVNKRWEGKTDEQADAIGDNLTAAKRRALQGRRSVGLREAAGVGAGATAAAGGGAYYLGNRNRQ